MREGGEGWRGGGAEREKREIVCECVCVSVCV